ncbi:hypothetical protein MPTK1_1g16320 [Marchantia polymorpha subsp. ruderalis]|uniref:OBERON-like protein n=2 Tax=Marchantia polymorpha TaxID=3197 RepID=A0AAF6AQS6_MARPO|nr:hypothetical protein MARPO_0033s0028 [Marchantia polymorpha]BBM98796.1 hypothetical protein Mp_1g16320 [Marchantia polymorpha subsp. ruderalis]|eukprot:PTQ41607.1 hypothetical protein MARPO_0033s0028 [Marchantia polymorpha]
MGNDKGNNESVKSEMEDGEVEPMTDDENVVVAEKSGGVKVKMEGVDDGEREGVGESGNKERRKEGSKDRDADSNHRAEQEVVVVVGSKGGAAWTMSEKKESRDGPEDGAEHDENVGGNDSEEEDGANEAETGERSEAQDVQNSDEGDDDDEDTETPDRIGEEDEEKTREEEERKDAEKDLALTMSSSWAPLGDRGERERERDIDGGIRSLPFKVTSKSGREEMAEREIGAFREVQSEGGFKERIRSREDDGEPSKEKSRLKKQRLEPLLSLSLPDTSLHLASPDGHGGRSSHGHAVKSKGLVPSSSENERSFRSLAPTQSQSNGYTNSLSLSLSHPFFHNASCSLTQNSFDDKEGTTCSSRQVSLKNERLEGTQGSHASCQISYGREPYFHGALSEGSHDRSKHRRELPLYHRILQNGSAQFQAGEGTRDSSRSFMDERGGSLLGNEGSHGGGHRPQDHHYRWKEEASLTTEMERSRTGHDRHWGIHRDKNERLQPEGWPSPTKASSVQALLADRERRDPDAGRELNLSGSRGYHERDDESTGPDRSGGGVEENPQGLQQTVRIWLHEIVSDSIATMAHKLHRVNEPFLESLRKCTQDMLTSKRRKDDFVTLQKILQKRNDLSIDTLHQSNRTQLEILVALKTGIPAFLHPDVPLTTGELTEIFLGTKCRNVACKSQLPADDCECKVCSGKLGFCNACMCIVCSKFDFDSNTCRWIGCDYCLHWCHSECGIQMGYISSGISSQGTSDNPVMLFRCIGCGQTSELYGFVKEVFASCCKEWSIEKLAGELECVRRIFHRTEDLPGKQLFSKAEQSLVKLRSSKDCEAVCASMMKFFNDRDLSTSKVASTRPTMQGSEAVVPPPRELNSKLADVVRDAMNVMKAPNADYTELENARHALQVLDTEVEEKRQVASEIQYERYCAKTRVEELENIVLMKENEANHFQQKAEECRREAEALTQIVQLKNEKIEEEYQIKLNKLRLSELEDKRRKWYEEVQAMEKSQREYSAMKMSMLMILDKHPVVQ